MIPSNVTGVATISVRVNPGPILIWLSNTKDKAFAVTELFSASPPPCPVTMTGIAGVPVAGVMVKLPDPTFRPVRPVGEPITVTVPEFTVMAPAMRVAASVNMPGLPKVRLPPKSLTPLMRSKP